jgi:hypothetical protein
MMKSYVIVIHEIDDPIDAVKLLREKLGDIKLMKNSLGIITTHSQAVHSDVYKAVSDELPFPDVGIACDDQCVNGEIGLYMLTVMILTSDDCFFACGHSGDVLRANDTEPVITDCYNCLIKELNGEPPKLALMYTPLMADRFPGEYIDTVSAINPHLPVFGSVANVKSTVEEHGGALTLCSGRASNSCVVMVLIAGDFTPKFFVSTFIESAVILHDIGEVTKCEKNILMEINGVNATDFLEKVGFSKVESNLYDYNVGLFSTAFILDSVIPGENQRQLVSRSPYAFTDEGVICLGNITYGAKISVAISTPESVVSTAKEMVQTIKDFGAQTALMYSCVGRRIGLLNNPMAELEIIKTELTGLDNYVAVYAHGEICPTLVVDGKVYNHEHNQSLIACIF